MHLSIIMFLIEQGRRRMRTTIELSDDHRSALHSLAAEGGFEVIQS
jgi:hypothetical protein